MKIAVTAKGMDLDAQMDERFGRCAYFIVFDPETRQYTALENPGARAASGAGPLAVQALSQAGVDVLITGNVGENAEKALNAAGIRVVLSDAPTVKNAIDTFLSQQS